MKRQNLMATKHTRSVANDSVSSKPTTFDNQRPETLPTSMVEEIRLAAYFKWATAGFPASDGIEFWLEAEREVQQANSTAK